MRAAIAELIQYRHLLLILTLRDIKIRYKQTAMGILWALLMPLLIVAAGILVKKALSVASGQPLSLTDVASVSVKALPWAFFAGSLRFATSSLTANHTLVTKIYFPREVFPLAAVLAHLFDFAISAVILAGLLALTGVGASIQLLWVPPLLFLLLLLTTALAMLLACANLFFRDVKYLVEILLTFGIFFTPVFYEATAFKDWGVLLLINPLGSLLECLNSTVVLQRAPDPFWFLYATVCTLIGLPLGWLAFHKAEPKFAEYI